VRKNRRTEAQSALIELNQFMERYYTENGRYVDGKDAPPTLPFSRVPRDGGTALYNLTVTATAEAFTISAKPVSTSAQGADRCGELTITEAGAKSASKTDCWRK
jgi:type IV pilus assembly protein PilE